METITLFNNLMAVYIPGYINFKRSFVISYRVPFKLGHPLQVIKGI